MPALQPCDVICEQQADGTPVLPPPEQLAYLLEYAVGFDRDEAMEEAREIFEAKDMDRLRRFITVSVGD